jgi:glycosyltransferase involved in cell wall biosynthesis
MQRSRLRTCPSRHVSIWIIVDRSMARVTILLPNYNRKTSLRQCLESVLAQRFQDWRLVVGDNASDDGSADVVRSFSDSRIRLVRRERNVGYVANTNLLLGEADDSELIAILHSDDWWEPEYLATMVGLLDQAPSALIAMSSARIVYDSGSSRLWAPHKRWTASADEAIWTPAVATRVLVRRWAPFTPSDVLARRQLYLRFPRFDEALPLTNDWLMWARAASVADVVFSPFPLANNRKHASSVTGEGDRDHRWAPESVRLARTIAVDWATEEPYPGALRELQRMNVVRMLLKAYQMAEQNRRSDAAYLGRIAQDAAPSRHWRRFAQACGGALTWAPPLLLRWLRELGFRAGKAIASQRRREGQFQPSNSDSRYQFAWLLQDALTLLAGSGDESAPADKERSLR